MPVRLGFIGTGGIAGMHFKNLEQIKDAKIVALTDIVKEKAVAAAARFEANAYTDFNKMLASEDLDAVYVCIRPGDHGVPELACIKQGVPMFIEKPVGADIETLKKIRAGIQRKKLITAVGYQDRYLDIIEKLKKFLDGRPVGLIKGYWMGGMPPVMWWRQKKLSGGQHLEQTTHTFDMARYLFGDVKRVAAVGSTGLMTEHEKYDIQDASAVHLEFASGLVGTIFSACFLQAGGSKVGLDIYGKDFYIEYQGRRSVSIERKAKTEVFRNANNSTLIEDQTFIDAILSGDGSKIRSPFEDAAKSAAVSIAASESLKSGNFEKVKL